MLWATFLRELALSMLSSRCALIIYLFLVCLRIGTYDDKWTRSHNWMNVTEIVVGGTQYLGNFVSAII